MSSQSGRRWRLSSGEALAVLAVAAVTLLACRSVRPPGTLTPVGADTPTVSRREVSQEELLRLLAERHRAVSTMRALVRVEGPEGSFMGTLQMQPPEHTRFEGLDPFGRTAFDFISTGEEFELYLPAKREVVRGRVEALEREAGPAVPVPLRDLLAAVTSFVSPFVDVEEVAALEQRDGAYLLNVFLVQARAARLVRRLWFEGDRLLLVREEVFGPSGAPRAAFAMEDFRLIDGEWRPHRLTLTRTGVGSRPAPVLTVEVREMMVNARLATDLFTFGPLPGVVIRDAEEEEP